MRYCAARHKGTEAKRKTIMDKPVDGFYLMFEIGWFLDLLIPTLVRVKDERCKKLSFDDPSLKAFKCLASLAAVENTADLESGLNRSLSNQDIRGRYFNTKGKQQKEATLDRIKNDYQVLSKI